MTTTGSATSTTLLTPDQLVAQAKTEAATASGSSGESAVQKLLDAHPLTDTVQLSPVSKLLAAQQTTTAAKSTSYFDSDAYLSAKVSALREQINLYSTMPDLDPSGAVLDDLTKQINDLVAKQQNKLKATQSDAAVKQAELKKEQDAAFKGFSSDTLLSRAQELSKTGKISTPISSDVQALLDLSKKGSNINQTV